MPKGKRKIAAANCIRNIRDVKGLTMPQVSAGTGIDLQQLYDYEFGYHNPSVGIALRIARFLGCKVEDIWSIQERNGGNDLEVRHPSERRI